jgi:type IV pilus assembly protein PilZ
MTELSELQQQSDDILIVHYGDKKELYEAYMPFVINGGLFVATKKTYHLGDEVSLLLQLWNEPEKISLTGKVVWITPSCAQGGRDAGVGIQFNLDENAKILHQKIETALAGMLNSDKKTNTM